MAKRQFRPETLEQYILALMLFNDEQGIALNSLLPEGYVCGSGASVNKTRNTVLNKIRGYINEHNAAPGMLADGLFARELVDGSTEARLVQQELNYLASAYSRLDAPTIEIVRSEIAGHLQIQSLTRSAEQFLQAVEDDPDEALQAFYTRASPSHRSTPLVPVNMLDTAGYFQRRREQHQERNQFRFPVACLEERWIAPKRKRVMTLAGPTHQGKSHLQREILYANLRYHPCMHIYCEHGDDPETEYKMLAYGFTKHPGDRRNPSALSAVQIPHLTFVNGELDHSFSNLTVDCIDNQEEYITAHAHQLANLYVYHSAPLALTFQDVRGELDRLRQAGIRIDMVAIDYPSKMKIDIRRELRLEEARLANEFSQLCADYDIAGISISQLNAEGNKAKCPTIYQLNESIDKAFIGDDIILLTADDDAKRAQVAYLICGKVKGEEHGMTAVVGNCLKIGRFCLDAVLIPDELVNEIKVIAPESVDAQILLALRANPSVTRTAIAAQFGVSEDKVDRIAWAFLSEAERAERPGRGRPRRTGIN
jgi:hypothetical protein